MKAMIVIGMNHSATSLVSGALHAAGLMMGAGGYRQFDRANFYYDPFESRDFAELNEEILAAAGGDWLHPPSAGRILEVREQFDSRALLLVSSAAESARLLNAPAWGWKHPSTTLTLPIYWPALCEVADPIIVYCQRRRDDCVSAIVEHFKLDPAEAAGLWETYRSRALAFLQQSSSL